MTNTKCSAGEGDTNEGKTSIGSGVRLTNGGAAENNEEPRFVYELSCN